jgi:hypothetical protein
MNKKTKNILLSGLATIAVFSAGALYYSSHFRYELEMSDAFRSLMIKQVWKRQMLLILLLKKKDLD